MAKKRYITETRYIIHYYSNGFCYRSTADCPKSAVTEAKRIAKLTGDTIKTEIYSKRRYEY